MKWSFVTIDISTKIKSQFMDNLWPTSYQILQPKQSTEFYLLTSMNFSSNLSKTSQRLV